MNNDNYLIKKMSQNEEIEFKIITLGDSGVGKTSIINRYVNDIFEEETLPTIGLGFSFKKLTLNGTKIKLKCIDTAGQEKYKSIARTYYKNADGVLLVFSYDDKKSFDHIESWLNSLKENRSNDENIVLALVGNKCDVENKVIENNLIEELKNRIGIKDYVSISAKDNIWIEELFNELAEILYNQNKKTGGDKQINLQLKQDKKKNCCRVSSDA